LAQADDQALLSAIVASLPPAENQVDSVALIR